MLDYRFLTVGALVLSTWHTLPPTLQRAGLHMPRLLLHLTRSG